MNKTEKKREREKQTVSEMIALYCRKNHGAKHGELCAGCKELRDYARLRIDKCPFMENKTFCSNCKIHCYKPEMRERIRKVMRYSGPRMIFRHPVMAVRHVIESKREKPICGLSTQDGYRPRWASTNRLCRIKRRYPLFCWTITI